MTSLLAAPAHATSEEVLEIMKDPEIRRVIMDELKRTPNLLRQMNNMTARDLQLMVDQIRQMATNAAPIVAPAAARLAVASGKVLALLESPAVLVASAGMAGFELTGQMVYRLNGEDIGTFASDDLLRDLNYIRRELFGSTAVASDRTDKHGDRGLETRADSGSAVTNAAE